MSNRFFSEEHLAKLKERAEYLRHVVGEVKSKSRELASPFTDIGRTTNESEQKFYVCARLDRAMTDELEELTVEIEILEKYLSGE